MGGRQEDERSEKRKQDRYSKKIACLGETSPPRY